MVCACGASAGALILTAADSPGALDYLQAVGAVGGLVGVVLAALALVYARQSAESARASAGAAERSASAAARTADAAEATAEAARQQVRLLRQEADVAARERGKRALVVAQLQLAPQGGSPANVQILTLNVWNRGELPLTSAFVEIRVLETVEIKRVMNQAGQSGPWAPPKLQREDGQKLLYEDLDEILSGVNRDFYFRLVFPGQGEHQITADVHYAPRRGDQVATAQTWITHTLQ